MTSLAAILPARATDALRRRQVVITGLMLLLAALTLASAGVGAVSIAPDQIIAILADRIGLSLPWSYEPRQEHVLLAIRLPRVLLGLAVGAGLAVSGAAMQGMFRNPLADPSLVGVSSGAALAAVSAIVLGAGWLRPLFDLFGAGTVQVAAFTGGLAATVLIYRLTTRAGRTSVPTMLLAGIAVNAMAGALTGLLTYIADDVQLRSIIFWTMGSLGGATWESTLPTVTLIAVPMLIAPRLSKGLNAMLLGEAEAGHLGVDVERVKRWTILLCALAVGASVAAAGGIGFIGLIAPHLLRMILGPDHRAVIPGSALLGASLLLGADLLSRTVVSPAELPIGIVTALLGAPLFLWLLVGREHSVGGK